MDNFESKVEEYLEQFKYDKSFTVYKCLVNKFMGFYSINGKSIEDYTEEDFKRFLNNSGGSANTFCTLKSRIIDLLEKTGYYNLTQYIRDIVPNGMKKEYIKTFDELDAKIEQARLDKFPFLKGAPKINKCDSLTMGQVILYLAWIGVPQRYIAQIPLSAIDLENNVVDAIRKYSFADNKKIIDVFTQYKNSNTFMTIKPNRTNKEIIDFKEEEYYGDRIVRPRKTTTIKKIENSIETIINRLSTSFPFVESYLNIQKAGQFARGYEKYLRGEIPDFSTSENIWNFFGAIAETDAQVFVLKTNWNSYVAWRKETD